MNEAYLSGVKVYENSTPSDMTIRRWAIELILKSYPETPLSQAKEEADKLVAWVQGNL